MAWHKYKAKKTTVDGITFPSQKEANRYLELKLLERSGVISELKLKPTFELQPAFTDNTGNQIKAIIYEADFQYIENGAVVVEDPKGVWTKIFRLKRKMFLRKYPEYILRIT
jgi:hypothetical protein